MPFTRRQLGHLALQALAPATAFRTASRMVDLQMPHSRRAGVDIGVRVPERRGSEGISSDSLLTWLVPLGVGTLELSGHTAEALLGAPREPALLRTPKESYETGLLPIEEEVFQDEMDLARATFAAQVRAWRASVSLAPLDTLRDRLAVAGMKVGIVSWDGFEALSDDEVDYGARIATALGARVLSTELSFGAPGRLATVAAKHGLTPGLHADEGTGSEALETAMRLAPSSGVSIDSTAWIAAGNGSPLPFLAQHANRITHVHLTTGHRAEGSDTPFGESGRPIRDVLHAMRDHRWPFPAIVQVPEAAHESEARPDPISDFLRALEYCRTALTS